MRFNKERMEELTNKSSSYYEWDKELLEALDRIGHKPSRDNEKYDFSFLIKKEKKQSHAKYVRVYFYNDGRIEFSATYKRMDNEEISLAYMSIAELIFEMQKLGIVC